MRKQLLGFICLLSVLACSKDADPEVPEVTRELPNLQVVGQDLEAQYWFRFDGTTEATELVDLSATADFRTVYLAARQVGSLVNFFTFGDGAFSVFRLDLQSGATDWVRNLYQVNQERSVIWGAASETDFFLGNYSPRNTTNYGYQALRFPGPESSDHTIAFRVQQVYQPLYGQGRLFLVYRDELAHYRLAVVHAENRELEQVLDYGADTPAIFFDEAGHLTVIRGLAEGGNRIERYDPATMVLQGQDNFPVERFFAPGPLEASLINEELFYTYDFAQPSPVVYGPAVFDLVTGENRVLDMAGIAGQVQEALGRSIVLGEVQYFPAAKVFAIGYFIDRPEPILEGGILLISADGSFLKRIDLPFNPTFIGEPGPIR